MTFVCPVSKLVNLQVIEAKNTQAVLEGLSRLGCEMGFPKFLVLDRETSFMKVVSQAEIDLQDLNLRSFKEYGIRFEASPVGAHNFSGLVERKIRTVQECFQKVDLQNKRLHSTGLQTIAKLVENHLNNLPLGFSFGRDASNTPLLKIITPNMLRLGRLNSRSLDGPVKLPKGPKEQMSKVESIYDAFFKIWNAVMVPRLIPQAKWFKSSPEVKVDDVVYFQKVENDISSKWTVGQIEAVTRSKDNVVRRVTVRYSNHGENVFRFTERSVRSLVRLFNIEDDYFVQDIEKAEKLIASLEKAAGVDQRVQSLMLVRDKKGGYSVRDSFAPVKPCQCCCSAHCSLSSHSVTGRVSGVAVDVAPLPSHDPYYTYSKEIVSKSDTCIPSDPMSFEAKDDLFNVLTALETQFDLP